MRKILSKRRIYKNPNDEVEKWKDRVYEEIKDLSSSKVEEYIDKKASRVLKRLGR